MAKGCGCVRAWVTDELVVGSNDQKPVSCDDYVNALERALLAVSLTPQNSEEFKYNPVRAVQRELGIEVDSKWTGVVSERAVKTGK